MLSVIIPARNEAAVIDGCLASLAGQDVDAADLGGVEIIVAANGCCDDTVERARSWAPPLAARGVTLEVVDATPPGKARALDVGDSAASGDIRVYLDADVVLSPPVLGQVAEALTMPGPRFAGGTLALVPPKSLSTRLFARVWARLPFFADGAPSPGLYAVNAAGRARWGRFPDIIADDGFVRALFTPDERVRVDASYTWPLAEGARRIVKVRRRQEVGNRELAALRPGLQVPPAERHGWRDLARLASRDPAGVLVYAALTGWAKLTVDMRDRRWHTGR